MKITQQELSQELNNKLLEIDTLDTKINTHLNDNASLTEKGHVQLNDAINSDSNDLAATPSAIKKTVNLVRPAILQKPPEVDVGIDVKVIDKGNGQYEVFPKVDQIYRRKAGLKTYYVDPVSGNDTNDGLGWSTALKTYNAAFSKSDVETVILRPGNYGSVENGGGVRLPAKDIRIISDRSKSIFYVGFSGAHVSWTDQSNGMWSCSTSQTLYGLFDTTQSDEMYNYHFGLLTLVASSAQCASTPQSYYKDGNTLYVHTADGRKPDANLCIVTGVRTLIVDSSVLTANRQFYLENIVHIGGTNLSSGLAGIKLTYTAKNCEYSFGKQFNMTDVNGLSSTGSVFSYLDSCIAERADLDGFNYHRSSGNMVNPQGIEYNCIGRYNGIGKGTNINNGSTVHEENTIIRIGGMYYGNEGRNVHDITDSKSWNIGCFASDSVASTSAAKSDFAVSNNAKMWLYKCTAYGSSDNNLQQENSATLYVRDSYYDRSAGSVTPY